MFSRWTDALSALSLSAVCLLTPGPATVASWAEEFSGVLLAEQSIRSDDLRKHVGVLASDAFEGRAAGSRGGHAAAGYITDALQRLPLEPAGESGGYYQHFGNGMRNILAVMEGSDPDAEQPYVVVGAHYDHVGYGTLRNSNGPTGRIHNGADDNASGVATLLEVAEAMSRLPERPARSVVFAFWDGEEDGLLGSKHWTRSPTLPLNQISTAINVDMVGRLRQHLEVFGSRTGLGWRNVVVRQNLAAELPLTFPWKLEADSDHYSFVENRIPVVMLHTGLHGDYHRPSDDAELIDTDGMQRIGRLLFRLTVSLANDPSPPRFRQDAWQEGDWAKEQFERAEWRAPSPRLGLNWKAEPSGGVRVTRIAADGPADRAGMKAGDVIEALNSEPAGEDFTAAVWAASSPIAMRVRRGETEEVAEVDVTLNGPPIRLGVSWRRDPGNPEAMWVSRVVAGSAADIARVLVGDRILSVNGESVANDDIFLQAVADSGKHRLEIDRQGRLIYLDVEIR